MNSLKEAPESDELQNFKARKAYLQRDAEWRKDKWRQLKDEWRRR